MHHFIDDELRFQLKPLPKAHSDMQELVVLRRVLAERRGSAVPHQPSQRRSSGLLSGKNLDVVQDPLPTELSTHGLNTPF